MFVPLLIYTIMNSSQSWEVQGRDRSMNVKGTPGERAHTLITSFVKLQTVEMGNIEIDSRLATEDPMQ